MDIYSVYNTKKLCIFLIQLPVYLHIRNYIFFLLQKCTGCPNNALSEYIARIIEADEYFDIWLQVKKSGGLNLGFSHFLFYVQNLTNLHWVSLHV